MKNFEIKMSSNPVRVTTFHLPPFAMKKDSELIGRDIEIIKALSKMLKFKVEFDFLQGNIPWGYLYDNGTGTGAIAQLLNNKTDIILGDYFLKLDRLKYFDACYPYFESKFVYIIPPPKRFSSFEKLSQPFQLDVWLTLCAFLLIGVFGITLVKLSRENLQNLVFGSKNSSPFTNMFLIILGMTQPVIPTKGFARFFLMMFILFCMVMRSIYEGSLFLFLQSDSTHREVKSVNDMLERNYEFYIGKSFVDLIHADSPLNHR